MFARGLTLLRKGCQEPCSLLTTRSVYRFAFPTMPSDYANLKKLSGLMNAKQLDINEEIVHDGPVRLVNSSNKQIGVMPFDEAFNKAKDMNLDIVMVNSTTNPVICKTVNYKEEVYAKFAKEIVTAAANERKADSKKPKKQLNLTINISSSDLKTKAQIVKENTKKNPQIKVVIQTTDAQEDQGKNILFTFRDLVKESMVAEHDLITRSLLKDDFDAEDLFNDKKATKQIELHLQSLEFNSTESNYSTEQIKKLVDQYLRADTKKIDPIAEEMKKNSKTLKQLEKMEGTSSLMSPKTLDEQLIDFQKDLKDEDADDESDSYVKVLEKISKRENRSVQEIENEVEALRARLVSTKEHALVFSLLEKEQKRLRDYKRTLKLATLVRK